MLVLRGQHIEQVPVPLPLGHIDRPLAASVLERSERSHSDQALGDLDTSTTVRSLMQWSIPGHPIGSNGVDQLFVLRKKVEYPWPVIALGSIGEDVTVLGRIVVQRPRPSNSIPDDAH